MVFGFGKDSEKNEPPSFKSRPSQSQALTRPIAPRSKKTETAGKSVKKKGNVELPKKERDVEKGPDKNEDAEASAPPPARRAKKTAPPPTQSVMIAALPPLRSVKKTAPPPTQSVMIASLPPIRSVKKTAPPPPPPPTQSVKKTAPPPPPPPTQSVKKTAPPPPPTLSVKKTAPPPRKSVKITSLKKTAPPPTRSVKKTAPPPSQSVKKKGKAVLPKKTGSDKNKDSGASAPRRKSTTPNEKPKEKEKATEDDKLKYDPEDDVWTLEEGKVSVGRKYARSVMSAFRPVLYLATILGLFPLTAPHRAKDGTYTIKFAWCSFASILFLFCATLVVGSTFWMLISLVCISINSPEHSATGGKLADIYRSEEIFVYKRNAVNLVIMIASYIHLTICMVAVFHRKDYIAKQLVYWTEVVELLQLDVGRNVARRLLRQLTAILLCLTAFVVLYFLDISPGLAGSGSTLYIMLTRVIDPNSLWHDNMKIRKLVFGAFLLYSVLAGYVYIVWFFFNCRILTNILRIWNNRFQYCLHKQILEFTNVNNQDIRLGAHADNRTSRAHLFQDHLVIFNLLEGVNAQFEVIMESFYLSTMLMIVFEAYGFVHACFYNEYTSCGSRQHDAIPILIMLGLQIFLYIIVTLEAAGVADEARHVLDIVRRKGMMTSRVDNELWFMMSMRLSFGGHEDVGIIGAGFFYITKAFLLGAISAITSHFIIFYQFEVPYAQTIEADSNFAKLDVQALFKQLEGVPNTKC